MAHDFHQDFADHCVRTFGEHTADYAQFEPYYDFGYEMALEDGYQDRTYGAAEADLRAEFRRRHPDADYDRFEEAIHFAFAYTQEHLPQ